MHFQSPFIWDFSLGFHDHSVLITQAIYYKAFCLLRDFSNVSLWLEFCVFEKQHHKSEIVYLVHQVRVEVISVFHITVPLDLLVMVASVKFFHYKVTIFTS